MHINSLDDFCLWAPPKAGDTVGDSEQYEVSWCQKDGYGTRTIPEGTFTGLHWVTTPDYVQLTGKGKFTKVNVAAGDEGGELDPVSLRLGCSDHTTLADTFMRFSTATTRTETRSEGWSLSAGSRSTSGTRSSATTSSASGPARATARARPRCGATTSTTRWAASSTCPPRRATGTGSPSARASRASCRGSTPRRTGRCRRSRRATGTPRLRTPRERRRAARRTRLSREGLWWLLLPRP